MTVIKFKEIHPGQTFYYNDVEYTKCEIQKTMIGKINARANKNKHPHTCNTYFKSNDFIEIKG